MHAAYANQWKLLVYTSFFMKKESLNWDIHAGKRNHRLRHRIIKKADFQFWSREPLERVYVDLVWKLIFAMRRSCSWLIAQRWPAIAFHLFNIIFNIEKLYKSALKTITLKTKKIIPSQSISVLLLLIEYLKQWSRMILSRYE